MASPAMARSLVAVAVNTASSIAIVSVNKVVTRSFPYPTALALLHGLMTYGGMTAAWLLGAFRPAWALAPYHVLPLSLAFIGYVVINNISIRLNHLAFYQATKVLCTPIVAVMERVFYGKRHGAKVWASLAVIVFGVSLVSYSTFQDVFRTIVRTGELTPGMLRPFLLGLAGSLVTSFYSVWTKRASIRLNCTGPQLLYAHLPLSMLLMAILLPFFDSGLCGFRAGKFYFDTTYFFGALRDGYLAASCILAFLVNTSQFLVIGKMGPLTYSVVSQLKTIANFSISVFVLEEPVDAVKVAGILALAAGMGAYSYLAG